MAVVSVVVVVVVVVVLQLLAGPISWKPQSMGVGRGGIGRVVVGGVVTVVGHLDWAASRQEFPEVPATSHSQPWSPRRP